MAHQLNYCRPVKKSPRRRLNLSVDSELWKRFEPVLKKQWKGTITSWVEFAMECYSRDRCEGCPYDDGSLPKTKGVGKRHLRTQA